MHKQVETRQPDTTLTVVWGVILAVVLVVIFLVLQTWYYHAERQELARKAVMAPPEVASLRAQQLVQISSYQVLDPQGGVVAVPIERAFELLLQEQGKAGK